jgi:pimeloyl-ACP methyl ester carboxylesterase
LTGLAADVEAVLDAFGFTEVTLAGQDWGGLVCFRAVLDQPQRFDRYIALSIVPPWLRLASMLRRLPDWAYVFPMALAGDRVAQWPAGVRWLVQHGTGSPVWDDAGGRAALASYVERVGEPPAAAMTRRLYAELVLSYLPRACRRARPARLEVPTTILLGEHETIARPALYWSRTYPGEIRIVTVDGARHWLSEERPDAVVDVLRGPPGVRRRGRSSSA